MNVLGMWILPLMDYGAVYEMVKWEGRGGGEMLAAL